MRQDALGTSPSLLARQSRGLWDILSTIGSEDAKLQQETSTACFGRQAVLLLTAKVQEVQLVIQGQIQGEASSS